LGRIVGIDLGTTNSLVGVVEGGEPRIIPNERGDLLTPSVVRLLPGGLATAGVEAARTQALFPSTTVAGIKRFMGRSYHEVIDLAEMVPFQVVPGPENEAAVQAEGRVWLPEEISAEILKALKRSAEAYLGEPVTDAVVTVPAYLTERQRSATRRAAELAGLEVKRLVVEPVAAAMTLKHLEADEVILVADIGGGTFDVTIVVVGQKVAETATVDGDSQLGGRDFDEALLTWACAEIRDRHGRDVVLAREALLGLRDRLAAAKCDLSHTAEVNVPLAALSATFAADDHLTLSRPVFESVCAELFERVQAPIERVLARYGHGMYGLNVSRVVPVGGASRMPRFLEILEQTVQRPLWRRIPPELGIGAGATIQAGILEGSVKDMILLDVTPHSLGVEAADGRNVILIPRETTIPTKKSETFTSSAKNRNAVEINLLQGDRPLARENTLLGRLVLEHLQGDQPVVQVTVDIDANAFINVTATDRASGATKSLLVRYR
jgi:molecular chaperone DnaK